MMIALLHKVRFENSESTTLGCMFKHLIQIYQDQVNLMAAKYTLSLATFVTPLLC